MVRSGRWIGGLEAEYHLVCLGLPRHRVRWCQYQSFSDWTAIPAGGHRGRLLRESAMSPCHATQIWPQPGVLLYMSFWYRKLELARRFSVFYAASLVSGAFGGLLGEP